MYKDLSMRWDWPVKKAVAILPIRLKRTLKRFSGSSLISLGAQNKDIVTAVEKILELV